MVTQGSHRPGAGPAPHPEGRARRPQPRCISASDWPGHVFSAVCGFTRKGAVYGVDYSAAGRCHPNTGAVYSPQKAGAGRGRAGPALHPPPVKSPSGPLVTEPGRSSHVLKNSAGHSAAGCSTRQKGGPLSLRLMLASSPQLPCLNARSLGAGGANSGPTPACSVPWQCDPRHRPSLHLGFLICNTQVVNKSHFWGMVRRRRGA